MFRPRTRAPHPSRRRARRARRPRGTRPHRRTRASARWRRTSRRPLDVHGALVAEIREVLGDSRRSRVLVDRDVHGRGLTRGIASCRDDDHRDLRRHLVHAARDVCGRRDDDDPIDPLVDEAVEHVRRGVRVAGGHRGQRDEVVGTARRLFDREHGARGTVVRHARRDDADRGAAGRDEGARGLVPPIAERTDRGLHALARIVLDVGVPVEHARHRLVRDARRRGDVGHRRGSRDRHDSHPNAASSMRSDTPERARDWRSAPKMGNVNSRSRRVIFSPRSCASSSIGRAIDS